MQQTTQKMTDAQLEAALDNFVPMYCEADKLRPRFEQTDEELELAVDNMLPSREVFLLQEPKDTCLYFHRKKDTGEIFYVGIGNQSRPYRKDRRAQHWKNIVKKHDYVIEIIHNNLTWAKACELEISYIAKFGRSDLKLGTLCNKTNGGDGTYGMVHKEEAKSKMSMAQTERFSKPEEREKQSLITKELYANGILIPNSFTDDEIKVISDKNKIRWTPELRIEEGKKKTEMWKDPLIKAKASNTSKEQYRTGERTPPMLGKTHTEESKSKMSDKIQAWLTTPESKVVLKINGKKGWEGLTEEEHWEKVEKLKQAKENRTEEEKAIESINKANAQAIYMASLTTEEKLVLNSKISNTLRNKTPEEREATRLKSKATREANNAKRTPEEKEALHKKRSEASTKSNLAIQARKREEAKLKQNV